MTFYGGRGHTTTNFPSFFWTWLKSLRIQLHEKLPAFDILSGFKLTRVSLKERKFIFLPTLSLPSLSSLLKVPIFFFLSQFVPKIVTSTAIETRSSQSIKIGKSDLIDIDCIDQSVQIDDTLVSFIHLSWFLPISSIYIARYIWSSVHPKMKTDFMQAVNLLTIELQFIAEGSNNYHFLKKSF